MAEEYGRRWSTGAAVRAEHFAAMAQPAWEAVADAAGIGPGTALLDVACGSGEFARLARARGARVCGIDAAEAMAALARDAVPDVDVRVGTLERLPWPDAGFDVVAGFNAFQFAPDIVAALAEAGRVTCPGGRVAVCNWGGAGPHDLVGLTHALQALAAEPTLVPRRPIGEPGVLEGFLDAAGLRPEATGEVAVPWSPPDVRTLERGLLAAGNLVPVVERMGVEPVRVALRKAAEPFRGADGSYRFANTFRWVVAARPERP